ncbi:MAG: hypothetical protein NC543_14005 [bacterium]|nr:hypothetical protein [bacterium]MCM1376458.1 hypothetical protein [Muribaculum sp.]
MRGKEKCKALKEIRRQIAEENDIPYVVSQCTHQGDCKGTCPRCEAELRYLERELAVRQGLGRAVAVVGISTSVCAGLTACSPVEMFKDAFGIGVVETAGDIEIAPESIEGKAAPIEPEELGGENNPEAGEETPDGSESGENALAGENGDSTQTEDRGENAPAGGSEENTRSEDSEGMELDGDIAMGEILPPEENWDLAGFLEPPTEESEESDESSAASEETAP